MSGSPFKPPSGNRSEASPGPGPDGVPPITMREAEQPANGHSAPRGKFQFSLRSLLLFTTGVSVLVSLVAWLCMVFFMVTIMLAGFITVFVGTYLLDNRVILAGGIMMAISTVLSPFMFVFAGL